MPGHSGRVQLVSMGHIVPRVSAGKTGTWALPRASQPQNTTHVILRSRFKFCFRIRIFAG